MTGQYGTSAIIAIPRRGDTFALQEEAADDVGLSGRVAFLLGRGIG